MNLYLKHTKRTGSNLIQIIRMAKHTIRIRARHPWISPSIADQWVRVQAVKYNSIPCRSRPEHRECPRRWNPSWQPWSTCSRWGACRRWRYPRCHRSQPQTSRCNQALWQSFPRQQAPLPVPWVPWWGGTWRWWWERRRGEPETHTRCGCQWWHWSSAWCGRGQLKSSWDLETNGEGYMNYMD